MARDQRNEIGNDALHLDRNGFHQLRNANMSLIHNPTIAMLVYPPVSNLRPKNLSEIRHCCETRLFASCTSRILEQTVGDPNYE